ncbi:MAG: hypothetical protein AB7L91_18015 [Dehalococcoidia bacterium]
MRKIVTGPRLAIRVDADTLLAVPPMHPHTPRDVRVRVFEYVLRRQPALAAMLAEASAHEVDGIAPEMARLAALMGETPWSSRRRAAA